VRRTVTTTGEMDLLTEATLAELAHHRGPAHLSLFMPTHRAGPETRQDPIRFRNLVSRASPLLATHEGLSAHEADELLAPVRELLDDHELWRHQADGLAVYAAPGLLRTVRVPLALDEEVVVGRRFRLRPLLPLLADDGRFYVLALSQNDVRLYEGHGAWHGRGAGSVCSSLSGAAVTARRRSMSLDMATLSSRSVTSMGTPMQ
jgi:hypothetical protein